MSAAYLIAQLKVTNSENYKEYIEKVPEIIKKYGGEYLARGGTISAQPPVRTISWEEARDLIEKLAYQVEARKEDEAELDRLDQEEGFQVDYKEEN